LQCVSACCSVHDVYINIEGLYTHQSLHAYISSWSLVLQRVAVCCNVLQYVVMCCSVSQCTCMLPLRHPWTDATRVEDRELQCVALCCSVLQCVAVCCVARTRHLRVILSLIHLELIVGAATDVSKVSFTAILHMYNERRADFWEFLPRGNLGHAHTFLKIQLYSHWTVIWHIQIQ